MDEEGDQQVYPAATVSLQSSSNHTTIQSQLSKKKFLAP